MKKKFKISHRVICLFIIGVYFFFPSISYSDSQIVENPIVKKKSTAVQQIGPNEYKIGAIVVDKHKKEINIHGSVNMQNGLVEYLACHAEVGKLHESVLKFEAKPSDLQVALLLLGFKPKNNLKFQGDPTIPEGDQLEIWAEWELPNKSIKRVRAEELVCDPEKKKTMDKTYWVFTGSQIIDGQFMADIEGSLIATFRDPAAIINNPLPSGADDTRYVSNEKLLPSQGTEVVLIIKGTEQEPSKGASSPKALKKK